MKIFGALNISFFPVLRAIATPLWIVSILSSCASEKGLGTEIKSINKDTASVTKEVLSAEPDAGYEVKPPVPVAAPSTDNYIQFSDGDYTTEQWETIFGEQMIVRNTETAGLYYFKPIAAKSNGRAVIIIPGGGYSFVSMGNEGFTVAQHLASQGFTAFVLKYRVRKTPREGRQFLDAIAPGFMTLGQYRLEGFEPAAQDFIAALDYLQVECPTLGCQSDKISAIGFSAGARTIMDGFEAAQRTAELESMALMYPPTIDTFDVNSTTPLFVGIAANDPLFAQGEFTLLSDWLERSKDLEFHLYSDGGHGFGMSKSGTTSQDWISQYSEWLTTHVVKQVSENSK